MTDSREYEVVENVATEMENDGVRARGKDVRNISLNLDLRQIRKPGTYVIKAEDKVTSEVYTFTLNYRTAPYVCVRKETEDERKHRIENQKLIDKTNRHSTLAKSFDATAVSGRALISDMAHVAKSSERTVRRYVREFSDEFRVKGGWVTKLNGAGK